MTETQQITIKPFVSRIITLNICIGRYLELLPKMAILEFLEKKLMKEINNLILLNIGIPCACC